jgi:acetyl-CoA C-acetyltransferase
MTNVVIASAARTPVGSFLGSFANTPAHELGRIVIEAVVERAGVDKAEVSETILGQVLTAAQGQNPARQAHINAGLPKESAAWGINQVCGSGLRAVALGAQHIMLGDADIVVAGGQENMSMSPHAAALRQGQKMGDMKYIDTMIRDGCGTPSTATTWARPPRTWPSNGRSPATCRTNSPSPPEQGRGRAEGRQVRRRDHAVTIKTRKGDIVVDSDEYIRHGATMEAMQKLRPAFTKDGSVTAANASGLNDGAAATLLMSAESRRKARHPAAGADRLYATAGLDPSIMGVGPIYASRKALEKAGWKVDDLDLVEANEAFAAQACAVNKDMGWDPEIVNVNGGAIAIGHPIGASGARVLNTLLFEMQRRDAKKGLATLCIGGGMGVALCVERD